MKNIFITLFLYCSFSLFAKAFDTMDPALTTDTNVNIQDLWTDPFTADGSCLDYCFKGVCFWLDCEIWPPSCSIKTSLRVGHNNPDFVVSAFPDLGGNPWEEFTSIWGDIHENLGQEVVSWIGMPSEVTGGGEAVTTSEQDTTKQHTNSTTFREVDVVGYYYDFSNYSDEYFCGSNVTAFMPHYSSAMDGYLWRTGTTDVLYTLHVFLESIGIPYFKEWGGIYWRTGFIKQLNPAKANAVLSMRAAHIASRSGETRVYMPASGDPDSDQRFFRNPGGIEADGSNGSVWQMIAPKKDNECYVFDDIAESEPTGADTWANGRWSDNQSSSVYMVWRPYECCKKQDDVYLFSVEVEICLSGGFTL